MSFSCKEEVVFYDTLNETNVYSGASELSQIDFVNNQLGFAIGFNGTVLKTNNGGSLWSVISGFDSKINFNSLSIVEDSIIFISGRSITFNDKALYKSIDYGNSWSELTVSNVNELDQTHFVSKNIGYSVSSWDLLKTVNGGISFQPIVLSNNFRTHKIYFLNPLKGLAYSDDYEIRYTFDGGATWSVSSNDYAEFYYVNDFDMNVNGVGVIVDEHGSVITTSNYGENWSKDYKPTADNMKDVALLTVQIIDNTIITSGAYTIAFSDDMGFSWKTYYDQEVRSIYYKDFHFFDKKNGLGIRGNSIFKISKVD
ncbi:hypothetical protein N9242_05680 [Vicingaceae bacterium]|nr:hypothetical protein [Vicingaceae bacterium]